MNIQDLKDRGLIIFECITGSTAYGTNLPTSDIDIKGVFIQPLDDILGMGYVEQVNDEKNDITYYEIRRFLELITSNNPNLLEMLNVPEDCIKYKHPVFDMIIENSDKFITKLCRDSFAGYAVTQIKKARGLNKKIVNPVDKERKSPLDFCYIITGYKSEPLVPWLEKMGYEQKFCGLVNVPNARDVYSLFFDEIAFSCFSEKFSESIRSVNKKNAQEKYGHVGLGYKGILLEGEDGFASNEVRLSSVPLGQTPVATIIYNKDGYTKYCKDYKEYWSWVENRNEARYNDNANHGKGYDGKNLSHCHRLLDMSIEIAEGKGINVRRPNRDELLSIRRGEMDYDLLVSSAEDKIKKIDFLYNNCNLPSCVDKSFTNNLLINIRKKFYGL